MSLPDLPARITSIIERGADITRRIRGALAAIGKEFNASTGTVHCMDPNGENLYHVASFGLPEKVLEVTQKIPVGKGMAGLCAQRREPVTVCNLQEDTSGTARPGARQTLVAGGIVTPILDRQNVKVVGTLGVGKPEEHEYSAEEIAVLAQCAKALSASVVEFVSEVLDA